MEYGKLFALQILKPKILEQKGSVVFTECYHCKSRIKEIISRVKDNRGKFCSVDCKKKFKISDVHRNLICKTKMNITINEFQDLIKQEKLTNSKLARKLGITIKKVETLLEIFKIEQYFDPESQLIERQCTNCGKKFLIKEYRLRGTKDKGLFCSASCKYSHRANVSFDDSSLQFNKEDYKFFKINDQLGDYSKLSLGSRSKQFVNKSKFNHFFFSNGINSEETAYFLGLMMSDGSVFKSAKGSFGARIQLTDKQIIYDLAKILNYKNKISLSKKDTFNLRKSRAYSINLTSRYLYHDLVCLGCVPNKTYTANYPDIEPEFDRHFIRGIIDGDGCFHLKGGKMLTTAIVGNDLIMYGMYLRIKKHLNINAASVFMEGKSEKYKMKSFARLNYGKNHSIKIRDWIYENAKIYMKRKKDIAYSNYDVITDLLGTQKIADTLSVSRFTISRFIKNPKNKIKYDVRGKYRYIKPDFLSDFLEKFKEYVATSKDIYFNQNQKRAVSISTIEDFFK